MRRLAVIVVGCAFAAAGCGSSNHTVTLTHVVNNQQSALNSDTATTATAGTQSQTIPTTTVTTRPKAPKTTSSASDTVTSPTTSSTTFTVTNPGTAAVTGPNPTTTTTSDTSTTGGGPVVHAASFSSPSGNIGCVLLGGEARCDIKHRDWSPPARPASCSTQVDFGQGLYVAQHGKGHFVCAGDTALGAGRTLAYGSRSKYGGFTCASAESGMTCTNNASGHGFFISVQSYRIF